MIPRPKIMSDAFSRNMGQVIDYVIQRKIPGTKWGWVNIKTARNYVLAIEILKEYQAREPNNQIRIFTKMTDENIKRRAQIENIE